MTTDTPQPFPQDPAFAPNPDQTDDFRSPATPQEQAQPTPANDSFARFQKPVAQENPQTEFDPAAAKAAVLAVYDHNLDGYPEYGDVRNEDGTVSTHVALPEELAKTPNALAAAVPIGAPATCETTGMVVERHALVDGSLPAVSDPERPRFAAPYAAAMQAHAAAGNDLAGKTGDALPADVAPAYADKERASGGITTVSKET